MDSRKHRRDLLTSWAHFIGSNIRPEPSRMFEAKLLERLLEIERKVLSEMATPRALVDASGSDANDGDEG